MSPEELPSLEAISIGKEEGTYSYYYTGICDLIATDTAKAMVELNKYSLIIAGHAGPPPPKDFPCPWRRFTLTGLEDFAGPVINSPPELLKLIDEKTYNQVMSCKVLRFTDPEGTDVRWTNYDDKRFFLSDHIFARPYSIGYGFGGKDDCVGVVAGTTCHLGAFPHCKAYIEGGQVVKLEGGGKYGEIWREKLEQYRNVKLPPLSLPAQGGLMLAEDEVAEKYEVSEPGIFWYWECAIGTIPGIFRLAKEAQFECFGNALHERRRSGVIHHGFGPMLHGQRELIAAGLPWVHVHIHSLFATLEGKTDKGKPITIIEKGHLTALDDPEVRLLASKYGNPDMLLTEAWIPAIPGINVPGDYMKDYARDPISWIKREAEEHPIWVD